VTEDDLSIWLEALAGRTGGGQARAQREALALRAWIRSQVLAEPIPGVAAFDPQREAQLIERARAAGLLPSVPPKPAWLDRLRSFTSPRVTLALATLTTAVVALLVVRMPAPQVETMRGAENGVVRLEASNPQQLQLQLLAELHAAGVHATAYERLGRYGIDAELPAPLPASVLQVLQQHHIPPPADHILTVEVSGP